jgi:hypothetical protein
MVSNGKENNELYDRARERIENCITQFSKTKILLCEFSFCVVVYCLCLTDYLPEPCLIAVDVLCVVLEFNLDVLYKKDIL